MKKTLIALLCFLLSASLTHASFLNLCPRIGVHISQYKESFVIKNTEPTNLLLKDQWGYHVGAFTRFNLSLFYIQPEILVTNSGAKFSNKNNKELKYSFTKLDIPAMVGISFGGVVRTQIGPVFSLLLKAKKGGNDIKEHYRSPTVGWQAGLGIDIWKIIIDLKYEGYLSGLGETIAGIHTNHGYASWLLSVGVNIL